jgi:hypothetical protein
VTHSPAVRLLLATRSLLLTGPARTFAPVAADEVTLRDHGRRYRIWRLEDGLSARKGRRLCELKQLTRAFGVLHRLAGGAFSRDIAYCLEIADQLHPPSAAVLRAAWTALPACPPCDVSDVRAFLLAAPVLRR